MTGYPGKVRRGLRVRIVNKITAIWMSATTEKDQARAAHPNCSMIDPAMGGPRSAAMPPACASAPIVRVDDICVFVNRGTQANRDDAQVPPEKA